MQTAGYQTDYREGLLDLAWSLWVELGVSGFTRRHSHWMIDPEELLIFTAWLGNHDARLVEETADWCIRFGDNLSTDRLKNLLESQDERTQTGYAEISGLVRAHKGPRLPGPTNPGRKFTPSSKSSRPDLSRPALLSLRIRKVLGVGAKAELFTRFLTTPGRRVTINELCREGLGFARITISKAIEDLVESGVVRVDQTRREHQFHLEFPATAHEVLDLEACWRPRWDLLFRLLRLGSTIVESAPSQDERLAKMDWAEDSKVIKPLLDGLGLAPCKINDDALLRTGLGVSALGLILGGVQGLAGGLLLTGALSSATQRDAWRRWFVSFCKTVSLGNFPVPDPLRPVCPEDAAIFRLLKAVRREASFRSGFRSDFGLDVTLSRIAQRRPKTIEELQQTAEPPGSLDPQLAAAYMRILRESGHSQR